MRDSVVFYRSFYEAIKELPDEQFAACVRAIMDYGLDGLEPSSAGIAKSIYLMAKPQIDANNRRYQNGTKGGRPKTTTEPRNNQTETKSKPKNNLPETTTEPNVNVNDKDNEKDKDINTSCPEPDRTAPGETVAISFPLNDGSMYNVTENDVIMYQQLYPGIDCMQELRKIVGWCDSHPSQRKTKRGAKGFVNGWLSRAQDKARPVQAATKPTNNRFHNYEQRDTDYETIVRQNLVKKLREDDGNGETKQ